MKSVNKLKFIVVFLLSLGMINAVYLLGAGTSLVQAISSPLSGPIVTPTPSPISGPINPVTVVSQVSASSDDVNEINGSLDGATRPTAWIGNAGSGQNSWTGLRFTGVNVPQGAVIKSAKLEVYSATNQWIKVKIDLAAEASASARTFSNDSVPSSRVLTIQKVYKATNNKWNSGQWYEVGDLQSVVQEVVSAPGWQSGNSIAVIIHGVGPAWGRKFVTSFDGSPVLAPKLTITY